MNVLPTGRRNANSLARRCVGVIPSQGAMSNLASDYVLSPINCGDVLFAEDLTGEGNANRELPGPRRSLILPVPDDFDIRRWATAA